MAMTIEAKEVVVIKERVEAIIKSDEVWLPAPGFPKYAVGDLGHIKSVKTEHILSPSHNQQGHLKVNLVKGAQVFTRNVNHLVAKTYLDRPPRSDFISLIHLDGDKTNCRKVNLAWRPRYFAIKYHLQFNTQNFHQSTMSVRDLKTGEVWTIQEAVIRFGLLFNDILVSAHTRTYVWPTYQEFAPIEN